MSKIEDLINELCPNGVSFYQLGDIATFSQGIQVPVEEQQYIKEEGTIRFLRIIDYNNDGEPPRYIKKPDDKYIKKEKDLIMIRYGTPGKVCIDYEGAIANNMFKINFQMKDVNTKYMYYYLSQSHIYNSLSTSVKSTMPSINFGIVSKLKVAVPPLEVQNEIVRILDSFNLFSAELLEELKARQIQYEHYRNEFYNSISNFEEYLLGDIVEFINGKAYKQEELLENGKYKVLRVGNFCTNDRWYYSNLELDEDKYCNNGDLLYLWSATFGPQIWHEEKTIFHYHIWKLKFDETRIDKMFLYYFLDYDKDNLKSLTTNSTMPHISMTNMKTRTIKIPPMYIQKSIVEKLNTFYELANNRLTGLPAEIEARQKQYEYYRDKLLTFKELEVNEVQ